MTILQIKSEKEGVEAVKLAFGLGEGKYIKTNLGEAKAGLKMAHKNLGSAGDNAT